jgi:CheY-like chemotaxis protein
MAKLMLLDDDEEALMWMSAALENRGHEVRTFSSARGALEVLEDVAPDLIVADMMMPEIDGLAFARLAAERRETPLMFVSIAKREAEAVIAGAIGYVQKPATAAEIRAAVERILGEGDRRAMILVVDDDPAVRDLYGLFLEGRFVVRTAENGQEALELMRRERMDLVIVDVHMPVMNGVELVRAMRRDRALESIPTLVQTNDRSALEAPVWSTLRVSKVMDKVELARWLEARVGAPRPPRARRTTRADRAHR